MDASFLTELSKYSESVAIIMSLTIFTIVLGRFWRNNNGKIEKKIREIENNHLTTIEKRLEKLETRIEKIEGNEIKIFERLAKLEVKQK